MGGMASAFCFVLLAAPPVLFLFGRLFPSHRRKFGAWVGNKVMLKVHSKCIQQKKDLFKSFELVPSSGSNSKPHVLEIGVGSGNNLAFLPTVCTFTCLDPNREHQDYVLQSLKHHPGVSLDKFVVGFAENMKEFEANTFDAVVCTFTLCSVRHVDKAIKEIKRVLKPGGLFFFMEHIAAPKTSGHRSLQECIDWVWPSLTDGCHLTRETWLSIEGAGYTSTKLEYFQLRTHLAFIKYTMYGYAVK